MSLFWLWRFQFADPIYYTTLVLLCLTANVIFKFCDPTKIKTLGPAIIQHGIESSKWFFITTHVQWNIIILVWGSLSKLSEGSLSHCIDGEVNGSVCLASEGGGQYKYIYNTWKMCLSSAYLNFNSGKHTQVHFIEVLLTVLWTLDDGRTSEWQMSEIKLKHTPPHTQDMQVFPQRGVKSSNEHLSS